MKGKLYAAFMERRGRRIFEGAGCYWHDVGQRMIMSIPYHEPMEPPADAVTDLLRRHNLLGARYLAPEGNGLAGGLYLRRKGPYDIKSVHHMSRNRLRRGLAKCTVRPVEKSELLEQGLALNLDTMKRQGRYDSEFGEPAQWARLVEACYASEGVCVMGSFVEDALASHAITLTEEGCVHIMHVFSSARFIDEFFPAKALTFTLTKRVEEPEIDSVSYGVAGLVHGAGLHEYKTRYGYDFIPYGYAFVLHPLAHLALANSLTSWALRRARQKWPEKQTFERIQSVVEGARLTTPHRLQPRLTEELPLG